MNYLINADQFARMRRYESIIEFDSYTTFEAWNIECVNALSMGDRQVLQAIVTMLTKDSLNIVVMNTCTEWSAGGFYYNKKKQLCLVHPR
jgi:hypothetical protein